MSITTSIKPVYILNEFNFFLGSFGANKNIYALEKRNFSFPSLYHDHLNKLPVTTSIKVNCIDSGLLKYDDIDFVNYINLKRISSSVSSLIFSALHKEMPIEFPIKSNSISKLLNAINDKPKLLNVIFNIPEFKHVKYFAMPFLVDKQLVTLVIERII